MDDRKIVYPKQRELDGVYTCVERNGHWYSVCFSDLTDEEQDVYDKIQTICKKEGASIEEVTVVFLYFCANSKNTPFLREWFEKVKNEK